MRYQTFAEVSPVVGMTKDPLFAPVVAAMNGMRVRVVVEVHLPREGARRQRAVLGIGAGAAVVDGVAGGVRRAGRGRRDRGRRRDVRRDRERRGVARRAAEGVGDDAAERRAAVAERAATRACSSTTSHRRCSRCCAATGTRAAPAPDAATVNVAAWPVGDGGVRRVLRDRRRLARGVADAVHRAGASIQVVEAAVGRDLEVDGRADARWRRRRRCPSRG